jgi:flagellar biogenesis protein FliO
MWARFLEILRSARVQRRERRLEIIERVPLGNKQSVALLRIDQREFVVGCCADSVVLLVAPATEPAKAKPKRARSLKSRPVRVQATREQIKSSVPEKAPAKAPLSSAKAAALAGASGKNRIPSKTDLVKSFAGSAR